MNNCDKYLKQILAGESLFDSSKALYSITGCKCIYKYRVSVNPALHLVPSIFLKLSKLCSMLIELSNYQITI